MVDTAYRNEDVVYNTRRTAWGAIWAGMFTFVAIWSVFGMLGEAIFASASPAAAAPAAHMSVGLGIWMFVLTFIAMYIAGRVTSHFADVPDRAGRVIHGMAMFGLSVIAAMLLVVLAGNASATAAVAGVGAGHSPYLLAVISYVGWLGWVSLILGWLGAMGGAAQGPARRTLAMPEQEREIRGIRPAA